MLWAYALATSCAQGELLPFRVGDSAGGPPCGSVTVEDAVTGEILLTSTISGEHWTLRVPDDWRSSLYRAVFRPGAGEDGEVWFVVRTDRPTGPVLLSVPFATWQAYNRAGVPGEGLYWTEDPWRAARVSFDRPGGGPPPERWEDGLLRWLRSERIDVDLCSDLDLHLRPDLLRHYRLLVVNGHDEYWTWEMRDTVENFTRRGGNLAVFGGNTCWWQMRLEDDGRTMVCYRDAAADPCVNPELTTVEWCAAPVHRPENTLTGISFRLGAGCWGPGMATMYEDAYTVRFADHWVFDGTGLTDGDKFAQGALGYETDAADIVEIAGVPRATGRDGTPASFAVLATADLRHWSAHGQGGAATMGIFSSGAGTVFNAGTVNWGAELADPVVARITRNVIDRLCAPQTGWTAIGPRDGVRALAAGGNLLFAVLDDGMLATREECAQNLLWQRVQPAPDVVALAVPREAFPDGPYGVYAATSTGRLLCRPVTEAVAGWQDIGCCPAGTRSLASCDGRLFALDDADVVWTTMQGALCRQWSRFDGGTALRGITAMNGRLFAIDAEDGVLCRPAITGTDWQSVGGADGVDVMTAHAGWLIGAGDGRPLRRSADVRPALPPGGDHRLDVDQVDLAGGE
ncbi:MAG TPA: N,N-dimethylformamidase beta subunit family domain-containing protein [Pseudonocardiaceae bacterium]|nr:N,N-dimethylformamidase beta subunit family domain-containing protein [Pseudonocardiaceae bacterium]